MIKFKRLINGKDLEIPSYATPGSAGMDIRSAEDLVIPINRIKMVKTGFACAIPKDYEIQV